MTDRSEVDALHRAISEHQAEIARLNALLTSLAADGQRLDFLDRCNAALNRHYGTNYGWKLIRSPNVVRLMSQASTASGYLSDIDLHDSDGSVNKHKSCRDAIDQALSQPEQREDRHE